MRPLLAVVTLVVASPAFSEPPRPAPPGGWEDAFRQGDLGAPPVGDYRGTVLSAEGLFPRVKARVQGAVWKGKTFHGDGTFINHWLGGGRAVSGFSAVGTSWIDGRPTLTTRYPRSAQVFGGDYDELRELSPGVWLGRRFNATTGRPKNWFLLEAR
jgi:hypothetical protein